MPEQNMVRHKRKPGFYERYIKRLMDVSASLVALILLSPLILLVALVVRIKLGSPVLFRQRRAGYRGQPFEILKFRTMTDERNEKGELLPDAVRLKPLGIFLRKYSLDELPQFINILRGDLSLVGPRPLLMNYLDLYTPEQARRHDVKPGVTGLTQVNGRNAISWEEKFRWDIKYVDEISFWLDVKILLRTVLKVIRPQGINQAGHATMSAFTGSARSTSMYALPELLRRLLITENDWNVVPRPIQAAVVLLVERIQNLEKRVAIAEAAATRSAAPGGVVARGGDFEDEPLTKPVEVPAAVYEEEVTYSDREEMSVALAGRTAKPGTATIEEMMDVTREVRYTSEELNRILEEETAAARVASEVPARVRK